MRKRNLDAKWQEREKPKNKIEAKLLGYYVKIRIIERRTFSSATEQNQKLTENIETSKKCAFFLIHAGGRHARVFTLARKWGPRVIFLLKRCRGWATLAVGTPAATWLIPFLVPHVAVAIPAVPILVLISVPISIPTITFCIPVSIPIFLTVAPVPVTVTAIAATRATGTSFSARGR